VTKPLTAIMKTLSRILMLFKVSNVCLYTAPPNSLLFTGVGAKLLGEPLPRNKR
jgi:hypothetical protein